MASNFDVWLLEFARGASTRLTFHPAVERAPVWSSDGTHIAYASNRDGAFNIYQKASSGAGSEEPLLQSSEHKIPDDWSREGRFVLYASLDPKMRSDLRVLPLTGADRKPFPFVRTVFIRRDRRWEAIPHRQRSSQHPSDHSGVELAGGAETMILSAGAKLGAYEIPALEVLPSLKEGSRYGRQMKPRVGLSGEEVEPGPRR